MSRRRTARIAILWPLVGLNVALAGGTYTPVASLNIARQEHGAALLRGLVYVAGGEGEADAYRTVERYDPALNQWSFVADLPVPLYHAALVAANDRLYLIGGYPAVGPADSLDSVYVYDPDANQWGTAARLPQPRSTGAAANINGLIYYAGGLDDSSRVSASLFIYHPATNQWTNGPDMPTAREHVFAVVVGSDLYIIGGRDSGVPLAVNEKYDTVRNEWSSLAPMPTARSSQAIGAWQGRIYVMGGVTPDLVEVNEVYNVATDSWSLDTKMLVPRHGVPVVTLPDGRLLLAGGSVVQHYHPTAYCDIFEPVVPGDLNCDGVTDFRDINPFVLALSDPVAYTQQYPDCDTLHGDCNGDGLVDFRDINPFVAILASGWP
jgi:N-acetylneuraminic acid mutarotase